MDETTALIGIIVAAGVGIVATLGIIRRQKAAVDALQRESEFAVSTEGMKRCPSCGFGNLVTDGQCATCGKPLPG